MKKKIMQVIFTLGLLSILFTGCCLSHEWQEATCTNPKTCSKCGKTEGDALGHSWQEATCTEPQTCSVCGETEGKAAGHVVSTEATCTDSAICSVCEEIVEEAHGHMWMEATCTEPKTCNVCRKEEGKAIGHRIDPEGVCSACGESIGIDINRNNWSDFFSIEYEWIYEESLFGGYVLTNSQGFHYTGCRISVTPLKGGNYENVVISYKLTITSDYGAPRGCFEIGNTMGEFMVDKNGNGYEEVIVTAYKKDPYTVAYLVPEMSIESSVITGHYTK